MWEEGERRMTNGHSGYYHGKINNYHIFLCVVYSEDKEGEYATISSWKASIDWKILSIIWRRKKKEQGKKNGNKERRIGGLKVISLFTLFWLYKLSVLYPVSWPY